MAVRPAVVRHCAAALQAGGRRRPRHAACHPDRGFAVSSGNPVIDFRSDTVTAPCQRLRQAIAAAEVGDDVYGEDPSVNRLEQYAAYLLGKEAAVFVPSGTMGNLMAVGVHCRRGDEVILGAKSHMFTYEGGGASAFMGTSYHTLKEQPDGTLAAEDIKEAVRPDDPHYARSRLLCLENSHNRCGGKALSAQQTQRMADVARRHGLRVHIDGARLMNAATALGCPPRDLAEAADSVTVCLSKGLGAPVGSVLCGAGDFIGKARRLRKALGGGMRQAGVLAAAGLEALINNYPRLKEDHVNARALAEGLSTIPGIEVNPGDVQTNMVYFNVVGMPVVDLASELRHQHGVLISGTEGKTLTRAVTHLQVSADDVGRALDAIAQVMAAHDSPRQLSSM